MAEAIDIQPFEELKINQEEYPIENTINFLKKKSQPLTSRRKSQGDGERSSLGRIIEDFQDAP